MSASRRAELEKQVRKYLVENYENANSPNDLFRFCIDIDAAIEELADSYLDSQEIRDLEFPEKIERVWKPYKNIFVDLHRERNKLAHKSVNKDQIAISLAPNYASFVQQIWPTIFESSDPPPYVKPPALISGHHSSSHVRENIGYRLPSSVPSQARSPQIASKEQTEAEPRQIEWRLLLVALGLLVLTSWLSGLTLGMLDGLSVLGALLAGAAAFVTGLLTFVVVIRFARSAGFGLVLAILLALVAGWWVLRFVVLDGPNPAFAHGYDMASSIYGFINPASPEIFEEPTLPTQPRPTIVSTDDAPLRETSTPSAGQSIEQQVPTEDTQLPNSSGGSLSIGIKAQVVTAGNRLNGRDTPGLSGTIQVAFENGEIVDVIDGPVTADSYKWWLVRGAEGEGWSADEFLEPIQ